MDAQEAIVALQLLSTGFVLTYASLLDWRTRRVGNILWLALSAVAVLLLVARVVADDEPLEHLLVLVPVLAILADVYGHSDEARGLRRYAPVALYLTAIVVTAYLAYLWVDQDYFAHLLTVPVMMLLVVAMYMLDLVKGGADAKALMALAIMFPFYPEIGPLPAISAEASSAELLFPFTFVILLTAAIIVAFTPLVFAARNLASGEFSFPLALFGYRLDVEEARKSHVWLMEHMEGDIHRAHTRPRADEDISAELDKLTSAGHTRVWVTPKVPFIIPMTVAFVFTSVVGSILVIITGA